MQVFIPFEPAIRLLNRRRSSGGAGRYRPPRAAGTPSGPTRELGQLRRSPPAPPPPVKVLSPSDIGGPVTCSDARPGIRHPDDIDREITPRDMLILSGLGLLTSLTTAAPRSVSNSWHFLGRNGLALPRGPAFRRRIRPPPRPARRAVPRCRPRTPPRPRRPRTTAGRAWC